MAATTRVRSRGWCFTINNPTETKEEVKNKFKNYKCIIIGLEKGEKEQTPHLQGYIHYKNPISFNTIKKIIPTAHIECAKGDPQQNYKYCSKDGDFISEGEFQKNGGNGVEENKCLIRGLINEPYAAKYVCDKSYIRHKSAYDEVISVYRYRLRMRQLLSERGAAVLRKWQVQVAERLFSQNDRQILWMVERHGGVGKTWFAKYLAAVYGFDLFDGVTASRDICTQLSPIPLGIIFDVTRRDSAHFSYQTLEQCKNGRVMTGKYRGYIREFKPVPVVVFANFLPDQTCLSLDRWDILDNEELQSVQDEEGTTRLQASYPPPDPQTLWKDGLFEEEAEQRDNDPADA